MELGRRRYGGDEEWLAKKSFIKGVGEDPQSFGAWYSSSAVNETLHALGVYVELRRKREQRPKMRARNFLLPPRFQMGRNNLQVMSESSYRTSLVNSCSALRASGDMRPSFR